MPIDLAAYESKLILRNLRLDDFDAVVALQLKCFPTMKPWTREQFESHIARFPEGQFALELDGALIGSSASLVVDHDDYTDWHDWNAVSDGGTIRNHDPEGDTLYGIEIQVDPEFRGMRLARRLYEARKQLCRDRGLARIVIGGRLPGYKDHKDRLTARQYVEAVVARELHDPVLTAQLANGFVVKELIPDYLPSDEDSAGYATHLEWTNLDYVPPRVRGRQAVHRVRVASVQYQMRPIQAWEDFERQCAFFVDTAADYNADFVLFPELFTLQLLSLVEGRPGAAARALAEFTPRFLELFADLALRYNINIIAGSTFTVEEGQLWNVAHLFRRDGSIGRQRKLHVTPSESRWWGVRGGDGVQVFETDRGPIGISICYDIEFPETARVLADAGARILFVPYNTNDRYGHDRVTRCAQARCIENHVYVVTAGCVGNLPAVENADVHYAQSGIYTPCDVGFARDGIAAQAMPGAETVIVHDLDTESLRRHKATGTTKNWQDRRTDLYRVVWRGAGTSEREV